MNSKEKQFKEKTELNFLNVKISNCIKGIAAVSIMLGHYFANLDYKFSLLLAGNLWVAIFFFYSGYGLNYSKKNKTDYITKFIPNKFFSVYLPFFIAETMFTLVNSIVGNEQYTVFSFLLSCLGLKLSNGVLWYIIELLVLYFLFYVENRFFSKFNTKLVWYIIFVGFLIFSVIEDVDTWWYISTFAFLIGYHFEIYEKIFDFINSKRILQILTIVCFLILYVTLKFFIVTRMQIMMIRATYMIVLLDLILAPMFVIFVSVICQLVSAKLQTLKPFVFLSKYSYEIYLWHMFSLLCIQYFVTNIYVSIILSVVATCVVSFIAAKINAVINNKNNRLVKNA